MSYQVGRLDGYQQATSSIGDSTRAMLVTVEGTSLSIALHETCNFEALRPSSSPLHLARHKTRCIPRRVLVIAG